MKQVVFHQIGLPSEVLQLEDAPIPQARANEVLVRVTARNINPSDITFVRGLYGITPRFPSSAGFEAVGIVEQTDEKSTIPVGAKVVFTAIGTWKEYVCVPAAMAIPVPAQMPDGIACQAFINPMTAYGMIESSGIQPGDWLLITAGASAFGKLAIQFAKQKDIKVACTVRQDSQKAYLLEMGADLVVNTETEKLQKTIMETTGEGVHVVFDAVGGVLGAKALASLRAGGKMLVFGLLSMENIPLNSGLLIFKNLKVAGFWLTTWIESLSAEVRQKAFKTVFSHLLSQNVKLDVAATYPLEQFREALQAYETSGRNGKILLVS